MSKLQSPSYILILFFLFVLSLSSTFEIVSAGVHKKKDLTKKDLIDAPLLDSKIKTNRTILVGPKERIKSIQDAIDRVPKGNSEWTIIHLRAGIYREKVMIPKNKEKIFLRGNGKGRTAIVWSDGSSDNSESATFTVHANNFVAFGISIKNDAPLSVKDTPFNQSVAVMVAGDKVAFYHCAFYSPHNTLFDNKGRHYYESCYIQGNIDFIFGRGQSIFQSCEIFVLADQRTKILGSITSHYRQSAKEKSGFVFLEGKVYGTGSVYLGRPRGAHSRVIWAKTYLSKCIDPHGWTDWSYDGHTEQVLQGEYQTKGPGADPAGRVSWSSQLGEEETAPFMTVDFINGKEWLPAYNH
ncbi:uncharacterized protein A4U43_C05F1750 [Asparagus officinalis]|uniref:pectinesterase n=1 Tax=Asparagus officinalis TaxID=4686 RepID=A0A5P1ENL5_ASPOF|nr:probable pectinesterase 67 [Asparagus officinalis]ONK67598.1 uncharacterized protein A4U43_C05F1750 [Asparagus officinalis]